MDVLGTEDKADLLALFKGVGGGDLVLIALGGEGHIVNARGDGLGVEVVLDVRDLDLLAVFEGPRRRAGPGLKVGVERDALLNVLDLFEEVLPDRPCSRRGSALRRAP